jgi:molybdopterin-containing oxidoreductase family iron-sulfur binding subunit
MTESTQSSGVRRREFLKVLGVSGAATAAVGCGTGEVERLIPYLNHPDNTVPGVSTYYATTCRECAAGCGVIAETRDGRAIKLEGNPVHPLNRGALCARGQAALQGLYNPDRIRAPMMRRAANGPLEPATWDEALQALAQRIGALGAGAANAVFINRHETGSFPALLDVWLAAHGMPAHLSLDALADHAVATANRQTYGVAWPRLDFAGARLVVAFGADFLETWGASVPQQLDFADARAKLEAAPRFVYVGPRRSLTGLNADEWIPCRPGTELVIVNALRGQGSLAEAATASGVEAATLERLARDLTTRRPNLVLAGATTGNAMDLALAVNALNQSIGNAGISIRPDQPVAAFDGMATAAEVAEAIARMNARQVPIAFFRGVNPVFTMPRAANVAAALRNVPFKVSFSSYPDETTELCDLVLPDHHPLESWGDAQATPATMSLQQPAMEPVFQTRQTADVLLQVAQQTGRAAQLGGARDYRSWLIARFPGGSQAFATALRTAVAPGTTAGAARASRPLAAPPPAPPSFDQQQGDFFLVVYASPVLGEDGANKPWLQELADPVTKIAWQSWVELHPATARRLDVDPGDLVRVEANGQSVVAPAYPYPGVREDTVAMMFGRGHRSTRGDEAEPRRVTGYPEGAVLEGYGRYAKDIGVNPLDVLPLGFDRSGQLAWTSARVRLTRAGGHEQLATTEGSARQHGRGIAQAILVTDLGAREASGAERASEIAPQGSEGSEHARPGQAGASGGEAPTESGQGGQPAGGGGEHGGEHVFPGDASHDFLPGLRSPVAQDAQGELPSDDNLKGMYDPEHWSGMAKRRWAMTIDLARCTGCSACVTACYAENNLPTVGAPYQHSHSYGLPRRAGMNIARGREMTWIRLERYYEGDVETPHFESRFVPMLCQHCGNAPCEPVCPVYATYHAPDGLNVQVYNRCVGTRYCSNNCPYKVRYFNWFGYGEPARPQYAWPEPLNWQLNPDVTVRAKGVMEKCTFCVQRIREAENRAALEGRQLQPDEFTVACAQACPSRAITFGDAADESWTVARLAHDRRAYHVFEELNTYTAVVYLKRVNHPGQGQPVPAAEGGEHGSGH